MVQGLVVGLERGLVEGLVVGLERGLVQGLVEKWVSQVELLY